MHHNSSALVLELCFVNGLLSLMRTHYNTILGNAILDIALPYTKAKYNVENSRILCCLIFLCSLLVIFYIICIYTMTLYGLHPSHHTVQILCIGTDRSQQTVQTKIRLLLKKQSDQGLHCLLFHQHLLDALMQCYIKLFLFLGQVWQLFEVSQILEFLR